MKYLRKMTKGKELLEFYEKLFEGTSTNYGFFSYPHTFCPIPYKELILPLPFIKIIDTKPMRAANGKIQTAHTYKMHPRMEDTRLDHMVFAESLGVDLLNILDKKGYNIDNKTKIAFLVFLLTHDIGHGPFSHPFEQMVDGYKGMHEDVGRRTLQDKELSDILESIYPGLTDRVVNFKKYDEYGLSCLLEGIFDLDRAAFLIMDTYLMDGINNSDNFYDIVDSVYKIFDSIILSNGKVYYDYRCFREMDDFIRIRRENYGVYQSPNRLLDDLILKKLGVLAPITIDKKKDVFASLPDYIKEEIVRFIEFIGHMKRDKANIDLEEYYSFEDYNFERIFKLLILLDDETLTRYCLMCLASFDDFSRYYDIRINEEETGKEEFYVENKITAYKSNAEENVIFIKDGKELDYKDCTDRRVEDRFSETISYIPKVKERLDLEDQLREYLINEINQEFICGRCCTVSLEPLYSSDKDIIYILREYDRLVREGVSIEEFAKIYNMSVNQVLAFLYMFTSNRVVNSLAKKLLAPTLAYYYTDEEASNILNNKQKVFI